MAFLHNDKKRSHNVKSIGDNPYHLASIFGLCAMGLIQDNDNLTEAAIQEMLKIPFGEEGNAVTECPIFTVCLLAN